MGGNIVLDILPANISDAYLPIATNKNSESRIFTKKLLDQMP
jgi:hypothetical protein